MCHERRGTQSKVGPILSPRVYEEELFRKASWKRWHLTRVLKYRCSCRRERRMGELYIESRRSNIIRT